jgi:hypothetical protein
LLFQLLEGGPGQFMEAQVQRYQDVLLGGEVVVDRGPDCEGYCSK